MNGKKSRWHERQTRRTEYYVRARAAARGYREVAAVEYDNVRSIIGQLPESDRDPAWRELGLTLERLAAKLAVKLTPPPSGRSGAQRTATRARVRRNR